MTDTNDQGQQQASRNVPVVVQAEHFVAHALADKRLDILAKSMPDHIDKDRFKRNLITAVAHHDKLLQCDPAAVFHEAGKASALGFYLDPALGEAYLITGYDSKRGGTVPQLRIGYRGLIKLARQSGQLSKVYAHEICANDERVITLGVDKTLVHKPDLLSEERGPVVGYYAVVHFSNGDYDFEVMNLAAIHRIRDRSDGWKAFKSGRIKSTPWETDEEEMAKKTVLRRLCKRMPQSPEMAAAFAIEDSDYVTIDGAPVQPRLKPHEMLRQRRLAAGQGPGFDNAEVQRQLAGGGAQGGPDAPAATTPADDTPNPAQGPESGTAGDDGADEGGLDLQSTCGECGAEPGVECDATCSSWDELDEALPEWVVQARAHAEKDDADVVDAEVEEIDAGGGKPDGWEGYREAAESGGPSRIAPPADDFPGDRKEPAPAAEQPQADAPKPKPTLAERSASYEARIKAAATPQELKRVGGSAVQLLKDLDDKDPERKVELDELFMRTLAELEEAARVARSQEQARG